MYRKYTIASLFSGAGGLDLGFQKAGYEIVWANEFDSSIWSTHEVNFLNCKLDKRSIVDVKNDDIPQVDGIIGGPPCQSWSEAGSQKGINDARGQLFYEYIRLLKERQPKFFLAENVAGILHKKHKEAYGTILEEFYRAGYVVEAKLINASSYNVPQDRKRVIIVGFHESIGKKFIFPKESSYKPTLKDAIFDLNELALPALSGGKTNDNDAIPYHEYLTEGFSSIYLSRNRVREWDEQSFTIQASGRHAPLHPGAPKMERVGKDSFIFSPGKEHLYRRLSVKECARIQTFPDSFIFHYKNLNNAYKMIGNAVPVNLSLAFAKEIKKQIE